MKIGIMLFIEKKPWLLIFCFFSSQAMEYAKDIQGYTEISFKRANIDLRRNCDDMRHAKKYFNKKMALYCKVKKDHEGTYYAFQLDISELVRPKLPIFHKTELSKYAYFRNFLNAYGLKASWFTGKHVFLISALLKNCEIVVNDRGENAINTDNLFKNTGLVPEKIKPQKTETEEVITASPPVIAPETTIIYQKPSLFSKLGYTALGFILAIPCCYAFFCKFDALKSYFSP